jgi:hypothetical protein
VEQARKVVVEQVPVPVDVLLGDTAEYPHARTRSRTNNSAFSAAPARRKIVQLDTADPIHLSLLKQLLGPAAVVATICVSVVFTLMPEAQLIVEYWSMRAAARSRSGGNRHIIVANNVGVELRCRIPQTFGTGNFLGFFDLPFF